jgi:hypothetical protein
MLEGTMNRNHSRDIVSKTGSRESQTPAEPSNEEFYSKVARLTSFGYSKVDIQQALKCDQGSLCRSILRLSKSQGSSSSDVGS